MFFIIIIIFLGFVGFIFINTKLGDLKHRATQQVLKNTGISSSEIESKVEGSVEKRHLKKFLEENESFTEESIRELLKQYTMKLINRDSINEFSQTVYEKMQKDSKLDKMQNMQCVRASINYYGKPKLNAIVVYTDNRDEYNIYLYCSMLGERIQLDKYQISKGSVIGF